MDCALDQPYRTGCFGEASETLPLRPGGLDLTRRAVRLAGFSAGDQVLDLGCGVGQGTQVLNALGCQVIGLDPAESSLTVASGRLPNLLPVVASAVQLPLADACLDGIVAECSLSLTENPGQVLAECWRTLRPGGRLAITDVFARKSQKQVDEEATAPYGCLAGISTHAGILESLALAGFQVDIWEDQSDVLKLFMARLILETDSPGVFRGPNSAATSEALRRYRPGYFLLIASKTGEDLPCQTTPFA